MAEVSPIILLDAVKEARKMRQAEDNLYEFLKQAWPVVEPGVEFTHGWHLQIICEHLEALSSGEIRKLLVNIPPRHSKSTIISVIYPVWQWLHNPSEQFLTASYSATLSTRDAAKSRHLITSPWFQERWGTRFNLNGDTNAKQRYQNDKRGYRISTSVGGTATGEGGSILILDDPHGAQDAQSDAMRGAALEWFDMVWSTRLNNARTDKMATIMQRLHQKDISGHILADLGGWEHICLPAEYDGVKRKTSVYVDGYDPRTKSGDLLWPERIDKKTLADLKRTLGEYAYEGQMQQRPSPPGGGILKVSHFQLWQTHLDLPSFEYVVQSVDPAYTEKTSGDPSAFTAWGVFTHKGKRGAMLLDAWADHMGYPQLRAKLVEEWHATYGKSDSRKGKKADALLIEQKASGQSLIQDLRQANLPAVPYLPTSDKISRAHQVAPILELDCLWLPESRNEGGKPVTWAREFLKQVEQFPNAEHDDYVDSLSQCIIYLRDGGWFEMPFAALDEIDEIDYHALKKRKENPYAA